MKNNWIMSDYRTEQIFSILRWIFLLISVVVFYYPPIASIKDGMMRDYLTGLYNHRHFQESIKIQVYTKKGFTVLLGDIDNFKRINDTHGHVVGDRVLEKIGEIFKSSIPPSIGSAFRYGGEEFAVLFHTVDKEKVISYVEQIYKKLQNSQFSSEKGLFSVTMSFGLFSELNKQNEHEDCVKKADELLYKAKSKGKNQAIFDCGTIVKGSIHKKEVS